MKASEPTFEEKEGSSSVDFTRKRYHLHTTISMATLEKLKVLELRFGNFAKTIDKAVAMLAIWENLPPATNKEDMDSLSMWHLMRSELNMVAVGKTTFLSYISDMPRKAFVENNAIEIIEWFYDFKNITELSIEAILLAIKKIWMSANYFREVRIEKIATDHFRVVFNHDLNDPKYSEFWATYFQVLFTEKLHCSVNVLIRPQIFHLEIQETKVNQ